MGLSLSLPVAAVPLVANATPIRSFYLNAQNKKLRDFFDCEEDILTEDKLSSPFLFLVEI